MAVCAVTALLSRDNIDMSGYCWGLGVCFAIVVVVCIGVMGINDAEQYVVDMEVIQNSIDITGDIATQSALLCLTGDIRISSCNRDMFDWYMSNHYDSSSNESMQVAMGMRGNIE